MTLVFNRSAASRLLGCKPEEILKFEVWQSVIFVHVKGQRPTFLSKIRFYYDFASIRKQGAKHCKIEAPLAGYPKQYSVISEGLDKRWHNVWMSRAYQSCDCCDFEEQKRLWGKGMCKHQYAVLDHLGCSSIAEAIAKGEQEYQKFLDVDWRESAPVVKAPIMAVTSQVPKKYCHVSVI